MRVLDMLLTKATLLLTHFDLRLLFSSSFPMATWYKSHELIKLVDGARSIVYPDETSRNTSLY